ncbi:MAG: universal stress protein [Thermoanaerobaculia bacterium]
MRILVATDGSPAGIAALKFGAKLTRPDGQLIVLTVEANGAGAAHPGPTAQEVLKGAARHLRKDHDTQFHVVRARRADEVPEAISREADRLRADMVVVGSEGRDTLNEWVVGGTALRLIYVARRPVTVVRAPRRRRAV